jgi:hypothetical protein
MKNKKVILITGYKRSGKDTFANLIIKKRNAEIFKLAQPLREMIKDFLDIDDFILEKEKEIFPFYIKNKKLNYVNKDMCIRDLMIIFSEGLKKYYGQTIFCEDIVNRIKNSQKELCLVSDLRYPYEAKYLKKEFPDALIVRIKRKGINLSSNHSSETSIDLIKEDVLIENNSSIKELEKNVDNFLANWNL